MANIFQLQDGSKKRQWSDTFLFRLFFVVTTHNTKEGNAQFLELSNIFLLLLFSSFRILRFLFVRNVKQVQVAILVHTSNGCQILLLFFFLGRKENCESRCLASSSRMNYQSTDNTPSKIIFNTIMLVSSIYIYFFD
ncbi:unnamed protein product [Coffea canephora]|uniref:Uncharacterized protein n=1 Tax=Coffea canephora TaxID=49390 RepID=A0A068UXK6_COFCA|nr:unnamed protein product [Coffea canephora]